MRLLKVFVGWPALVSALLLVGCASHHPAVHSVTELQFEQIERQVLHASKQDVRANFGAPSEVVPAEGATDEETWVYKRGETVRAMFGFSPASGLLVSKYWQIGDSDPERSIQTALNRFPAAKFKKRDARPASSHFATDETWYEDSAIGVSVTVRRMRNEAASISWFEPEKR